MMFKNTDRYITVHRAAKILGIHMDTLGAWVRLKNFPVIEKRPDDGGKRNRLVGVNDMGKWIFDTKFWGPFSLKEIREAIREQV